MYLKKYSKVKNKIGKENTINSVNTAYCCKENVGGSKVMNHVGTTHLYTFIRE